MLKILLLVSTFCFTQELKVEGNLNVTGAVINDSLVQVIDSLKATNINQQDLISSLQALIAQLQTQIASFESQIASLEAQMNLIGYGTGLTDCNGVVQGNSIFDCAGECGGTSLFDEEGTCCEVDEIDYCGICNGGADISDCVSDIDGNYYNIIQIGAQFWLKENLKVTHYNNGDEILEYSGIVDYGVYGFPNNDISNKEAYGLLYNFHVVNDDRGICPDGWHVPSHDEWEILSDSVTPNTGGKLKEAGTEHWNYPNTGANNQTGFTAVGSGNWQQGSVAGFDSFRYSAYFFTNYGYVNNTTQWKRLISDSNDFYLGDSTVPNSWGASIRCIKD